jgi:hypothetical protein
MKVKPVPEICDALGVYRERVQQLIRNDIVKLEAGRPGRGVTAQATLRDALRIAVVIRLTDIGVPREIAAEAADAVQPFVQDPEQFGGVYLLVTIEKPHLLPPGPGPVKANAMRGYFHYRVLRQADLAEDLGSNGYLSAAVVPIHMINEELSALYSPSAD